MNISVVIWRRAWGPACGRNGRRCLHRAGGMSLVEHVVAAARAVAPAGNLVVITGHQAEDVEETLVPTGVRFARQTEQKGTGHALACARASLAHEDGLLMVLYGDTPLLSAGTLMRLRDEQAGSSAAATLVTTTWRIRPATAGDCG